MDNQEHLFNQWSEKKKAISQKRSLIKFQQFHIVFMKIAQNIGYEQNGKGEDFLRPVLVYKKFNNRVFLGIPLTSKEKENKFHFEFEYKKGKKSFAILSQIRLFDIKRAKYYDGKISKKQFEKLQEKLLDLVVTPLTKKGECTKAICKDILFEKMLEVKFNVLITGANGQLGQEFQELALHNSQFQFFFYSKESLDIANKSQILEEVKKNNINVIVNCAAYTKVDKAEEEQELAEKINRYGVKNLGEVAKIQNIKFIHISTDYVFDGKSFKPYIESEKTSPETVYGQTKLAGENELLELELKNSCIVRTSWAYSPYGNNFVKTMMKFGKERDELKVVCDQIGTPTYGKDLALAILFLIPKLCNKKTEIFHYSNEGTVSWYDFAKEIMRMAKIDCNIIPIETREYPAPAKRPYFTVLNKKKIKEKFNLLIPYWKDSLEDCLKRLGERK